MPDATPSGDLPFSESADGVVVTVRLTPKAARDRIIGLGSLMALSASLSDYDMLWSAVALVALLSVFCHAGVAALERRVLSVYAAEQVPA